MISKRKNYETNKRVNVNQVEKINPKKFNQHHFQTLPNDGKVLHVAMLKFAASSPMLLFAFRWLFMFSSFLYKHPLNIYVVFICI